MVATVPVGQTPRGVAITPNGQFVYVTNSESDPGTVSVIATANNMVVKTITVGEFSQWRGHHPEWEVRLRDE